MEVFIFSVSRYGVVILKSRMYCLGVGEVLFDDVMESGYSVGKCRYERY